MKQDNKLTKIVKVGNMPQLEYSNYLMQVFWLCLTFAAAYLFVRHIFIPRITAGRGLRKRLIEENLSHAEQLLQEYQKLKSETSKMLLDVREQAALLQLQAEKEGKVILDQKLKESQQQVNQYLAAEEEKLTATMAALRQSVPEIVAEIKEEVLMFFTENKRKTKSH